MSWGSGLTNSLVAAFRRLSLRDRVTVETDDDEATDTLFDTLPNDLLSEILTYLSHIDFESLEEIEKMSPLWGKISHRAWKQLIRLYFPYSIDVARHAFDQKPKDLFFQELSYYATQVHSFCLTKKLDPMVSRRVNANLLRILGGDCSPIEHVPPMLIISLAIANNHAFDPSQLDDFHLIFALTLAVTHKNIFVIEKLAPLITNEDHKFIILFHTLGMNNLSILRILLKVLNCRYIHRLDGSWLLSVAATYDQTEAAILLLEKFREQITVDGIANALHQARIYQRVQITLVLLPIAFELLMADKLIDLVWWCIGDALIVAAEQGNVYFVDAFLEYDGNLLDPKNWPLLCDIITTPKITEKHLGEALKRATERCYSEMVHTLLSRPDISTQNKIKAMEIAHERGYTQIEKALFESCAFELDDIHWRRFHPASAVVLQFDRARFGSEEVLEPKEEKEEKSLKPSPKS